MCPNSGRTTCEGRILLCEHIPAGEEPLGRPGVTSITEGCKGNRPNNSTSGDAFFDGMTTESLSLALPCHLLQFSTAWTLTLVVGTLFQLNGLHADPEPETRTSRASSFPEQVLEALRLRAPKWHRWARLDTCVSAPEALRVLDMSWGLAKAQAHVSKLEVYIPAVALRRDPVHHRMIAAKGGFCNSAGR